LPLARIAADNSVLAVVADMRMSPIHSDVMVRRTADRSRHAIQQRSQREPPETARRRVAVPPSAATRAAALPRGPPEGMVPRVLADIPLSRFLSGRRYDDAMSLIIPGHSVE